MTGPMMVRMSRAVLGAASILVVAGATTAAAQEVYRDRYGVWRYVEPPVWQEPQRGWGAPPPVWREPPPDAYDDPYAAEAPALHLRGRVPSYDAPPPSAYADPWPGEVPEEWIPGGGRDRMRQDGYLDVPGAARPRLYDDYAAPDGPYDPAQPGLSLDGGDLYAPPPGEAEMGLAIYAAAKRAAVGLADPAARLQAIREANAWLVTLSRGPVTTEAIRAIDQRLGIGTIDKDTVSLPGAGTSVVRPSVEPTQADYEAARQVATYAEGGMIDGLTRAERTALDKFFGFDDGRLASRGG